MKKVMKFFGYIHYTELKDKAYEYSEAQDTIRDRLLYTAVDPDSYMDGLEEGYKGVGVLEFTSRIIREL